MKKNIVMVLVLLSLFSCGVDEEIITTDVENIELQNEINNNEYVVGGKQNNYIKVYGNILNNNIKTLSSKINGRIDYLECESGKKVYSNTLIAKVSPDSNDLSYKNNLIQLNSLKEQLNNQENIRTSTVLNFDSQLRQIKLQKDDLENQFRVINNNLGTDNLDSSGIEKQIILLNESKLLLLNNKNQSLKDIDDSIDNLKGTIFNTSTRAVKRLDEIFGLSSDNKDTNEDIDDYLGAKNSVLRNEVEQEVQIYLNKGYSSKDDLSVFSNLELSNGLGDFSILLKKTSKVIDDSISSQPNFSDTIIDNLYSEFVGYSDAILVLKTNFDKLINGRESSILTFDSKLKEIEQSREGLNIQKNNLGGNLESLNITKKNIEEQIINLEESKKSTLKQIDSQIISMKQGISSLNLMFQTNSIYAGINGTVKIKNAKKGNSVGIGDPVCTIVPDNNSLKLEIYSPENLNIGDNFEYFKDNKLLGEGKIISENPTKNSITQNYIYEGEVDFKLFKEGDYIDIKIIREVILEDSEIWVPLVYIKPKLDGHYATTKDDNGNIIQKRVEVGNMNNGEIKIISGIKNGDILLNK